MRYERVKKFPSWSPTSNSKTSKSLDESRPFPLQAKPHSDLPPTQEDIENEAFQQHKHEATGLEVQAQYGTLTPERQQRLTVLQAKMADFWQKKESQERSGINLLEIPNLFAPRQPLAAQPIQAKLTIGEPGDKYEQEADQVAARVVNQINSPQTKPSSQGGTVQRDKIGEEEDQLNKKPLSDAIQRDEIAEDEEKLDKKPLSDAIQRDEIAEDEDKLKMKPLVQRSSAAGGMAATPDLEASIQQARGSGQPLADSVREPMEQAFGADFSGVKVHTDTQSDQLNQSIQAKAFTTGKDIFFRQGEYDPGSRGGQELIAHELTHVVQQN